MSCKQLVEILRVDKALRKEFNKLVRQRIYDVVDDERASSSRLVRFISLNADDLYDCLEPFTIYSLDLYGGVTFNRKGIIDENGEKLVEESEKGNIKRVKKLLDDGVDINYQNNETGTSALIIASSFGDKKLVNLLLSYNADVDLQDCQGTTALSSASFQGNKEVVKLLINANADVNIRDEYGSTALFSASHSDEDEIVKLLLSVPDIDVNLIDGCGQTVLILASSLGHEKIVQILLEHGLSDIDIQENNGDTALMNAYRQPYIHASKSSYEKIVQMLLKAGANTNIKNNEGETASDIIPNSRKIGKKVVKNCTSSSPS